MVLTAYSALAFKDFYLPTLNDEDFTIPIEAELFQIPQTVNLRLETVGTDWRLNNPDGMVYTRNGTVFEQTTIKSGDFFRIGPSEAVAWVALIFSTNENTADSFLHVDLHKHPLITIGREPDNMICYNNQGLITGHHAEIACRDGKCTLIDKSQNGVFVGNQRVIGQRELSFGEMVNIYGLAMVFLGNTLAVDGRVQGVQIEAAFVESKATYDAPPNKVGKKNKTRILPFKRSPRTVGELHEEPFEIEAPPALQQQKKQPLLLTIGPSFTMVIPMLLGTMVTLLASNGGTGYYTGIVVVGAAGAFAVMWALIRLRNSKKTMEEDRKLREEQYGLYLGKIEDELRKQTEYNRGVLLTRYPDIQSCARYPWEKKNLWNRNFSHPDFLYVRLGLGELPFQAPITVPKERFSLVNDALAERPREIKKTYETIHEVPVGIDLMEKRLVGLFGNDGKAQAIGVARAMAMQIACNNCYTDVRMVFLYNETEQREWTFAKWLPHAWSEGRKARFVACNKTETSDILYILSTILRDRADTYESAAAEHRVFKPHYVLFISDLLLIEDEPISKYLFAHDANLGVTSIVLSESYEELPNNCTDLIEVDKTICGMYDVETMDANRKRIAFDAISSEEAEYVAREMSNIVVNESDSGGEIPGTLSFFDMHGVKRLEDFNVQEHWRKNRAYENMRALIGEKAGGALVYLDIHEKYHGPHGLVAGTTGSGKSETIQTYMLSLALNFSPQDVGFLVIDFKGGGMANLFSSLPHLLGKITNLSGNAVRRAMVSIKSEIRRRQRIFSEYEVNHLDKYMKLYKAKEASVPIPHLLIIIDEFAELKKEEPEFMKELISVAQVGRSLGVHLILATQKPAGVVDDSIWANSKFKLCLRVQDRQDSNDMLKKPDAAYITQTGRCYLQVGNDEIYELFQSGWSGAPYDEDATNMRTDTVALLSLTGRKTVGKTHKIEAKEAKRNRWIEQLITTVCAVLDRVPAKIEDSAYLETLNRDTIAALAEQGIDYLTGTTNQMRVNELIRYTLRAKAACPGGGAKEIAAYAIEDAARNKAKFPEQKEMTQLTAIVDYLDRTATMTGNRIDLKLWLPELPKHLLLENVCGKDVVHHVFDGHKWPERSKEWNLSATVGLCDDPVHQSQFPLTVDFRENGSMIVCGMAASGKSTFAQTMLFDLCMKYTPQAVTFYILDFSNKMLQPFAEAPHVGGIVNEDEPEKLAKFFVMMEKELSRRKKVFKGGSYEQYVRANGLTEPAIICVIDGYGNFREKTDSTFDMQIKSFARGAVNYGIYLALFSGGFGAGDMQSNLADNIKAVYCLEMGDKFKYAESLHSVRIDILPEPNIKGRGLVSLVQKEDEDDKGKSVALEYQTALCLDAPDDYARAEKMAELFRTMREAWTGKRAASIPEIPQNPTWKLFTEENGYAELVDQAGVLPIGYHARDASLYALELRRLFTFVIAGKPRTGKSNVMKALMSAAKQKTPDIVLLDTAEEDLAPYAKHMGIRCATPGQEYTDYIRELFNEMSKRNGRKRALRESGLSREKMDKVMLEEFAPQFIFIADLADFIMQIYTKKPNQLDVSGYLENFFDRGDGHNIYVFSALNTVDNGRLTGKRAYDLFIGRRAGVLTGGNAAEQRILDFSTLSYKEQTGVKKLGEVLVPASVAGEALTVIVPLVRE